MNTSISKVIYVWQERRFKLSVVCQEKWLNENKTMKIDEKLNRY